MTQDGTVGFAVVYRWDLRTGHEQAFEGAWARVTHLIRAERGGLGSRLHRLDDGTWAAYAQWPSREAWERSQAMPPVDPEASRVMGEAIVRSFETLTMDVRNDLLGG